MRCELAVGLGRGPGRRFCRGIYEVPGSALVVGPRRQGAVTEEAAGALALLPTAAPGRLVLFLVGGGRWVVGVHLFGWLVPVVQYHRYYSTTAYGQNLGI